MSTWTANEDVRHSVPMIATTASNRGAQQERLSGEEVQRLMRIHRVGIRELAKHMNLSMSRVRQVRARGVIGRLYCLDWREAIEQAGDAAKAGSRQHEKVRSGTTCF